MADFSQFRDSGQKLAPLSAQQAAPADGTATAVNSLAMLVGGVRNKIVSNSQAKREQQIEKEKSRITQELLTVADNQEIGELDQRSAQALIRSKYDQDLASGVISSDELRTIYGDFIDVGASLKKGTSAEQNQEKVFSAAQESGFVKPWMSQKEKKQAADNYLEFTLAGEKLRRAKTLREEGQAVRVEKQRAALSELNAAQTDKFKSDMQDVIQRLENGEVTEEEAVVLAKSQWTTILSVVNNQGSEAGSEYLNNMIAPMKATYELTLERLYNRIGREVYENIVARNVASAKADITGDPKRAALIATSSFFPNSEILIKTEINQMFLDVLGKNSDVTRPPADLTDPGEEGSTKNYVKITHDNIKAFNKGTAVNPEKTERDVQTNLIQSVKGVARYGAYVDTPKQLNNVIDLLADPETGSFLMKSGGVPADIAVEAKIVLDEAYKQPAMQAVLNLFNGGRIRSSNSFLSTNTDLDAASAILPVFTGSGVAFIMDSSVKGLDQVAVRAKVKELNNKTAPVVNRMIRLEAHLDGTQDYGKVYRDSYEEMFSPQEEASDAQARITTQPQAPSQDIPDEVPKRKANPQQVAKLKELKEQGYTREQVENVMGFLDLSANTAPVSELTAAIDEVF